jgi:hypothetical protein
VSGSWFWASVVVSDLAADGVFRLVGKEVDSMSLTHYFKGLFVLLAFSTFVAAGAQSPDQTAAATNIVTAKVKLDDLSMIIVPVSINSSGPYDFLLDTGCAKTTVDQKLAGALQLPRVGEKTAVGVLASAKMSVVHVDSLSLAGATVAGGEVFSSDHPATVTGKVRGVLGEDFLRNFDLLIDYRHQSIRLESPLGSMAQTATGEHICHCNLTGSTSARQHTIGSSCPATSRNLETPRWLFCQARQAWFDPSASEVTRSTT